MHYVPNSRRPKSVGNTINFVKGIFSKNPLGITPDYVLITISAVILILGLLMLASATSVLSFKISDTSYFFLARQLTHGVLPGLIFFIVTSRFDYRRYRTFTPFFLIATLFFLLLVFVPGLSAAQKGIRSWVTIFGVTLQTSEIAKLTFILWLSGWLTSHESQIKSFRAMVLPFSVIFGVVCLLLMLQPDIGTMLIFTGIGFILYFTAGGRFRHILLMMLAGLLIISPFVISANYRVQRLLTFWNPTADVQGAGYQTFQALIALGSGSWFGLGIGRSQQKFQFLPEIESDSIFAIIGEEGGFFLAVTIVILFGLLFVRGITIARKSSNLYGTLLAVGITFMIIIQVLINIGGMVGLLPLTGVPLPLISLGGTNLAVVLAALGILVNISSTNSEKNA